MVENISIKIHMQKLWSHKVSNRFAPQRTWYPKLLYVLFIVTYLKYIIIITPYILNSNN